MKMNAIRYWGIEDIRYEELRLDNSIFAEGAVNNTNVVNMGNNTVNNQGAKVFINNETLALSTAFGYDVMKRIEQLESRLRTMERN